MGEPIPYMAYILMVVIIAGMVGGPDSAMVALESTASDLTSSSAGFRSTIKLLLQMELTA